MTIERNTYYYTGSNVAAFTILVTELIPNGDYALTTPIQALAYVYDLAGVNVQTVKACGATREDALTLLHTTVDHVRADYMRGALGSVFNPFPILDPVVYNNLDSVRRRIADLLAA